MARSHKTLTLAARILNQIGREIILQIILMNLLSCLCFQPRPSPDPSDPSFSISLYIYIDIYIFIETPSWHAEHESAIRARCELG